MVQEQGRREAQETHENKDRLWWEGKKVDDEGDAQDLDDGGFKTWLC